MGLLCYLSGFCQYCAQWHHLFICIVPNVIVMNVVESERETIVCNFIHHIVILYDSTCCIMCNDICNRFCVILCIASKRQEVPKSAHSWLFINGPECLSVCDQRTVQKSQIVLETNTHILILKRWNRLLFMQQCPLVATHMHPSHRNLREILLLLKSSMAYPTQ